MTLALLAAAATTVLATTAFQPSHPRAAGQPKSISAAAIIDTTTDPAVPQSTTTPAAVGTAAAHADQRHHVVLVVGDSLIGQSDAQLRADSTPTVSVIPAYELGSAPCDWTDGTFAAGLQRVHPDVVVLAFVGNAGLSAGCVSTKGAFPLTELLSNYRLNLTTLANESTAAGAKVIFVTPPARNPGAPPPPDIPSIGEIAAPDAFLWLPGNSGNPRSVSRDD